MKRYVVYLVVAVALTTSLGCARTLVFSTGTTLGVKISTTEEAKQKLKLGFERSEGTLMPLDSGNAGGYSVFAHLCLTNRWPILQGDIGKYFGLLKLNPNEGSAWNMPSGIYIRQLFAVDGGAGKDPASTLAGDATLQCPPGNTSQGEAQAGGD